MQTLRVCLGPCRPNYRNEVAKPEGRQDSGELVVPRPLQYRRPRSATGDRWCLRHSFALTESIMIHSLKLLLGAAIIAVSPLTLHGEEKDMTDEVLVILSSESLQTQGMAMVLANAMVQKGAKVNVLLCDKAGDLALKSNDAPTLKPKGVTPGKMLRGLIEQGGVTNVCALYLPNSEYSKDDLIEGVGIAMPPDMASQMLDPKIRTFSF